MIYIGIDPGDKQTAIVTINGNGELIEHDYLYNLELLQRFKNGNYDRICNPAIEMIASYGMPVGKTVFETCVFIGRLVQVIDDHVFNRHTRVVYRKDVKMHLCQSMRAKDSNIRQAIIDRYPSTGGGKLPQVGTKNAQGPLYGLSGDKWAALGVALTAKATWGTLDTFEQWMTDSRLTK